MVAIPAPLTRVARRAPGVAAIAWRQRDFLRVFNLRTVAAMFYMALMVSLSAGLWKFFVEGFKEGTFFIAYFTRQTLISALLVLLAMAVADACLPRTMKPVRRIVTVGLLIALGAFGSTILRQQFGRAGTMDPVQLATWVMFVGCLWTTIGVISYLVLQSLREADDDRLALEQAQADQSSLASQMVEANLSALQAQIEPHFLFNTLANVRRLYELDASRGRTMLRHLVDYLRAALPSMRSAGSTLGQELDLIRAYLTILQLRMGERLAFQIDAGQAPAEAPLPPMVLPTLVENAIKHGLSCLPQGGAITVQARVDGGHLVVEVADTGCGFTGACGSGVGLANTRARLAALFGGDAGLELRNNEPSGVIARVHVPFKAAGAVA